MNQEIKNYGRHFAEQAHRAVGQMYDGVLPYDYHLRMAVEVAERFSYLLPDDDSIRASVFAAVWNHDTLEDTFVKYTDLKKAFGLLTAELVYAVTNEKGRTRKERASPSYYQGIRDTKYATFVKLCDRIANVRFGVIFGGKVDMYRNEQSQFEESLNGAPIEPELEGSANLDLVRYWPMVEYLRELLDGKTEA